MALLDDIKKKLSNIKPPASASTTGQQEAVLKGLQAKSGKVGSPAASTPRLSNQGEMQAQAQGAAQLNQVQATANQALTGLQAQQAAGQAQVQGQKDELAARNRMAQAGLAAGAVSADSALQAEREMTGSKLDADKEMRLSQMSAAMTEKANQLASERKLTVENIFSQFKQENKELALRKDMAQLEQTALVLALQDKAYLQQLDAVARTRSLEDDLSFREEAARLAMGQNYSLLKEDLAWQEAYNKSTRDFAQEMANMDITMAMEVANNVMRENNTKTVFEGVMAAGKAGVSAATDKKTDTDSTPEEE